MPRCPRCSKRFKTQFRVTAHMNQPRVSCGGHLQEMVRISDTVKHLRSERERRRPRQYHHDSEFDLDSPSLDIGPDAALYEDQYGTGGDTAVDLELHKPPVDTYYVEKYDGAALTYGQGTTLMGEFDADLHAEKRLDNLYYPFRSRDEWELALFLSTTRLSMPSIDKLLSLQIIRRLGLSFSTAKELRGRIEMLPKGPQWKCRPWKTIYPTKVPISLFYRDSLDCLQSLLHNPLLHDYLHFTPMRVFESAQKLMRFYGEWRTGNTAWEMQSNLPAGATLIGTMLSSDKTTISAMTGDRSAHPLLISLTNLDMDFRAKGSHNAFLLLALLPIPKFRHKNKRLCGVLESRLIHECLDLILQPLKKAAEIGVMMSDPLGYRRYCFTPLASFIVDTPEAAMLAGVGGKTSPFTMAMYKQFGDPFRHETRTGSTTIAQLMALDSKVDPWNLETYFSEARKFRLNGVHRPFWRDWSLTDPSIFLMPESLHHFHKEFWDHDAKWCIRAVGDQEIDFRFSILHPQTGFRTFKEGISKIKQVTGREHRDVQRYIVGVLSGAVPKDFVIAIRALMDFRYLAQAPEINEDGCQQIESALAEFHTHKQAILDIGARVGKGNKPIEHWEIPKLEFLQSVVPSIRANGSIIQFSADPTEHAHITEVKDPARSTNNQNYESQICRYLDRIDKCRRFDLATSVREAQVEFHVEDDKAEDDEAGSGDDDDDDDDNVDNKRHHVSSTSSLLTRIQSFSTLPGTTRVTKNFFRQAARLLQGEVLQAPQPFRTFANDSAAIHLARDPGFKQMTVDDVAKKFGLPDLRIAIINYHERVSRGVSTHVVAGRRIVREEGPLPSDQLKVWSKAHIQSKAYHQPHSPLAPRCINAFPPSEEWPAGRCDTVVVNSDPSHQWPFSGLKGHWIGQVRLIMHLVPGNNCWPSGGTACFLAYIQRFDIVPQLDPSGASLVKGMYPDAAHGMYVLRRAMRADGSRMGDIVPLSQLRDLVNLTPRFSAKADPRLTKEITLEHGSDFLLNKYFHKSMFAALHVSR